MKKKRIVIIEAFGRLDLLVSVACVAVLLMMVLPASANTRQAGHTIGCMSNLRQLIRAWQQYANDNDGILLAAAGGADNSTATWSGMGGLTHLTGPSAPGWLDLPIDHEGEVNPALTLPHSPMWPYLTEDAVTWRCPSDPSAGRSESYRDGAEVPRVRSYSMNSWLGGSAWNPGWKVFRRMDELTNPGPANTFTIIGERADSINDDKLIVDMTSFVDRDILGQGYFGRDLKIVDYPSGYHHRSAAVSFADGHVTLKSWIDGRTTPPLDRNRERTLNVASPGNFDVAWLQWHATRKTE